MEAKDLNKSIQEGMNLSSETQSGNITISTNSSTEIEITSSLHDDSTSEEESHPEDLIDDKHEEEEEDGHDLKVLPDSEKLDYPALTKDKIIGHMKHLLHHFPIRLIKEEIEKIKISFTSIYDNEVAQLKANFIASGELEENFAAPIDSYEVDFKDLLKQYQQKKTAFHLRIEAEKENNLKIKHEIIDSLKDLINRQESLNETFSEFRELQKRWHEIGLVPQKDVRDLWESYNYHIGNFYDYIKINKELRDLDLKKNLEAKIALCEKAELLLQEPSIVQAFKTLQKYHNAWREIGPVPNENKDDLWERFKDITGKINKLHQEYFEQLKEQLLKNLEAKTELCEKAENIANHEAKSPREWETKSEELIELQKIWKTIGFAPKKDNNPIYERFRNACDKFFDSKRDFFKAYKDKQHSNLQSKIELCEKAEALKESQDWKKTTETYIQIQKEWKKIGPVPRKHSDAVWKRFREACDFFFDSKSKFFSQIDHHHEENLNLKKALIEEINKFELTDNSDANFKTLQEFQRRWSDIGHVPFKDKDSINHDFRSIINKLFDSLNIDEKKKNFQRFKSKVEGIENSEKINIERNKIITKLKQLENDLTIWENNIGFFAKSKNSDALIRDFNNKIENGKKNIEMLNQKLDLLDKMI